MRRNKSALALAEKIKKSSQERQLATLEEYARTHSVHKAFQVARFLGDPYVLHTLVSRLKNRYYDELVDDNQVNPLSS